MNKEIIYIASFVAGAAIGSVVTWQLLKTKYEQIAQEEIDSMKEFFAEKKKEDELERKSEPRLKEDRDPDGNETPKEERKEMIIVSKEIANKYDYTAHSSTEKKEEEEEDMNDLNEPYVIPPEEYGEYMDYEQIELTYFQDGVLTDENYIPIDDIEGTVGIGFEDHFGEYEDDSVYVRNDMRRCEYEILADERNFSDVVAN